MDGETGSGGRLLTTAGVAIFRHLFCNVFIEKKLVYIDSKYFSKIKRRDKVLPHFSRSATGMRYGTPFVTPTSK